MLDALLPLFGELLLHLPLSLLLCGIKAKLLCILERLMSLLQLFGQLLDLTAHALRSAHRLELHHLALPIALPLSHHLSKLRLQNAIARVAKQTIHALTLPIRFDPGSPSHAELLVLHATHRHVRIAFNALLTLLLKALLRLALQLGLQPTALEHRLPCFLELLCQSIHLSQRLAAQPHFLLVSIVERHRLLLILLLSHHVTPRRKHEGQLRLQDPRARLQ